jgi:hypothetical protein
MAAKNNALIRDRNFHLARKERIVGIYYSVNNGIDIQVALGEARQGLFEQVPGAAPETYNLHAEMFKRAIADPELKSLLLQLELKLWDNVTEIRQEIEDRRAQDAAASEVVTG